MMMDNVMGNLPANGPEARESGRFYKLSAENGMKVVSGKKTPVLLNFFASNDVIHVGEITIPAGGIGPRQTDVDTHKGDAVFYVKEGPVTFYLPESKDVFQVEEDEYMFIPENIPYKMINYTGKVIKAVFIVGPEL